MSSVMRQDPWGVMPRLQDEINRLFGNARENDSSSATASWIPLVDIHEYADRFELYVDLPGVDPATVELDPRWRDLNLVGRTTAAGPQRQRGGPRTARGARTRPILPSLRPARYRG